MTQHKNATRTRILEAAEVIFADKGYHDAVVDEIAEETSLSKGGVYFHFPSKEDLFFAVLDRLADRLVTRVERESSPYESPLRRAEAALEAVLTALAKRRRLARLIMLQGYSMGNAFERKRVELFGRFATLITKHLDAAVAAGEIPPVDTEIASHIWLGAINELIIRWLYGGRPAPAQSLPLLRSVLIGGLKGSTTAASGAPAEAR